MADQAFILCVDDEPINITIMQELLAEQYQVQCVGSGQACLDAIAERRPDLVLLDVNMPDMDGLETCELLKNNPATSDIPVVFVSALATETELMAGYHAGGDDYITKPFSEDILQRKIEIVLKAESRKRQLLKMANNATKVLKYSQDSMSELDRVVMFLHDCFIQTEFQSLAKVVFDYLGRLQLDSCMVFIVEPEPLYWFNDEIDRPMERQILLNLNSQDRIVQFGTRLAINAPKATILIRNMPEEGDKITRLTEHLKVIIEGLDAKVKWMQIESELDRCRRAVEGGIEHANRQFEEIVVANRKQRTKADRIYAKLVTDIEQLIERQGMGATHIKTLQQIIKRFEDQTNKLNDEPQLTPKHLENIISEIGETLRDKKT